MRDFEVQKDNGNIKNDLFLEYTDKYKARNMVRIGKGDIYQYKDVGFNFNLFGRPVLDNQDAKLLLTNYFSQYSLFNEEFIFNKIDEQGNIDVTIKTTDGKRY